MQRQKGKYGMKKPKNKLAGLERRKAISGYIFIAPFIVGFLTFMLEPLLNSLYMSFSKVVLEAGSVSITPRLNGFSDFIYNYYDAFRINPDYNRLLTEELMKMFIYSLAIMVFSFFVALILNQKFHGRALVRSIFFLPVILSSGVMLGLESNNSLMASLAASVQESGNVVNITATLQSILKTAGVGVRAFETVFDVINNIYDVAIASGIQIIIYLSGLQTISSSMYEAADIEGCTKWESLWKITFPMISSLFLVNWIYTIVDYCMRSDSELMELIQDIMTKQLRYDLASAMSWAYFAIMIVIVAVSSAIISKGVYYYD